MQSFKNVVSPIDLEKRMGKDDLILLDCRRERGANHIVGAQMVDFEKDLTGQIIPGITGRHPLPRIDRFVDLCSKWGIDENKQVVVYDEYTGAWAARLWWMLKWLGHEHVAVLDGGWKYWQQENKPTTSGFIYPSPKKFVPKEDRSRLVPRSEIESIVQGKSKAILLDARAPERYRGEYEPYDPIAGHIPSAINLPFSENVNSEGLWRSKAEIKKRMSPVITDDENQETICYCGSGITACHNVLAASYAGLKMPRLYAGSWSDWINTMKE